MKIKSVLALIALALMLSGCVVGMTPIYAGIYTDVEGPFAVGSAGSYTKVGEAEAKGILFISTGDCSITAAMKNGGIKKVHHVDYHTENVLNIYTRVIVKVYGE